MKIAFGCDHGGYVIKEEVFNFLISKGYEVIDAGTFAPDSCDYPDYAEKVCLEVTEGNVDFGILICYTGIGMCIAANKVRGVRASLVHLVEDAILTREHNNSNVLCLSAKNTTIDDSIEIVEAYLNSSFTEGRHLQRVEKVCKIEDEERKSL